MFAGRVQGQAVIRDTGTQGHRDTRTAAAESESSNLPSNTETKKYFSNSGLLLVQTAEAFLWSQRLNVINKAHKGQSHRPQG